MEIKVNVEEIMNRVNLLHIRSFIFERNSEPLASELDSLTYNQRLYESSILLQERLRKVYKDDRNELEDAEIEYMAAMRAHSDVYAELGMKIGARLLFQLLFKDN